MSGLAETATRPRRRVDLGALTHGLELLTPFIIALAVGAVVLTVTGRDAVATYLLLVQQAFGSPDQIANTLVASTPVLFTGLATAVAFRAGVFNIGVEGSLYLGAFAAAWFGFSFVHLPGPLLILGAVVLAALAGLAWAVLPAVLRAFWRVDEVVTTLMLNYVAILFTSYLVNFWFLAPGVANSMSPLIAPSAQLGPLMPGTQLTLAFPVGLLMTLLFAYLFGRTTIGYRLRLVGLSPRFTAAAGIDFRRVVVVAMVISGALGGLAGGFQVLGVNYRFIDNFSPGYGFTGIAVALLGRNNALGILLAAIFFGALSNGGSMIQLFSKPARSDQRAPGHGHDLRGCRAESIGRAEAEAAP
jgi:ABC-type uncharacterized transport system, permease component